MKKLNQKGLTMVELIAVIAILAIVLIAVANTMNRAVREARDASYNTLLEEIKVAAENYASRTGITSVWVRELIEQGLIETGLDGLIHDPRTNAVLNCYQAHSEFVRGSWSATIEADNRATCPNRPPVLATMRPVISLSGTTITVLCTPNHNVIVTSNRGFHRAAQACPANGTISFGVALTHRPTVFTVTDRSPANETRSRSITWN